MKQTKVIVIGLDGATFEVINPLIEQGLLPTLAKIKESGASGILNSTFPPITGPAWLSLATGKNPGKTGVFDFRNIKSPQSFELKPLSSLEFRSNRCFWDYLSAEGKRIGIFNYPMLYPPYYINGFMIGGLGSPERGNIAYPSELMGELTKISRGYKIIIPFIRDYYTNKPALFLKDLNRLLEDQIKIIHYLLNRGKLDLFVFVLSVTDFLQHHMWNYWEEYKTNRQSKYGREFVQVWTRVDELIGSLLEKEPDSHFLIVSDHGFGTLDGYFCINKWLEQEGYLVRKNPYNNSTASPFRELAKLLLSQSKFLDELSKKRPFKRLSMQGRKDLIGMVDLSRSLAVALDHSAVGQIYINWVKRNPEAPVRTEEEFKKIRQEIIEKLVKLQGSSGLYSIEVHAAEDFYSGDKLDCLPDIVFLVNHMAYDVPPSQFDKLVGSNSNPNKPGDHRKEGIFMAYGPSIKPHVHIQNAQIVDVAPTLLHLFNQDVPQDMDGRILDEMMLDKTAAKGGHLQS